MNLRTFLRFLVSAVAMALPLSLSLAVAGPASAASWTKILSVQGAQSQACKMSIDDGRAWRVRVRLVAGASEQFRATYSVIGPGDRLVQRATLLAGSGATSAVKSVVIRRDGSQRLSASLGTKDGALGDSDILRFVGRC